MNPYRTPARRRPPPPSYEEQQARRADREMVGLLAACLALVGLVAFAALIMSCRPPSSPSRDVVAACANLRALGCPEGAPPIESCEAIVARRHDLHPLPLACWAEKHTIPEAQGCGSLRCLR